jgi:hypothetical protein
MQVRIQESEELLARMRNCQSAERPNPTISMRKKMDFFIGESEAESNPSIDYSEQ